MRGYHDVLRGVEMGTDTVLDEISARVESSGQSVGWVETTFDIDEEEDLRFLQELVPTRADLAATRVALETLGLYSSVARENPR